MKEIKYNTRVFIEENGQVIIRVRWNQKKNEVAFSVGCYAEPKKWDCGNQRAIYNTTHKVGDKTFIARDINNRIEKFLDSIKKAFADYGVQETVPTTKELKEYINRELKRDKQPTKTIEEKSFRDLFDEFMMKSKCEKNWDRKTEQKYNEMWAHLNSCDPKISLEKIDKEKMTEIKEWYVENKYRNRTITKMFRVIKAFLRGLHTNGYNVNEGALKYKTNLKVIKNTVTFLKFKELMSFATFEFPSEKNYLSKARDMFCFMAFTSLRYSDLAELRPSNISDDHIEVCTEKTDEVLLIPITEPAKKIIDKYVVYKGEKLFPVPSNQKLNDYLKEAAKLAGLDREVSKTHYVGSKRITVTKKFYEQISCHDARRTFVCCSLALGIDIPVVMRCTGHSTFEAMKPYIEVADETQKLQMSKWNTNSCKTEIIELLDKMDKETLEKFKRIGQEIFQKIA